MSDVRRIFGPYRLSDQSWRLIFKHDDGTRSSGYYKSEAEALSAIAEAEKAVAIRVGTEALIAGLLAQAVPCPPDPAWIYFLKDADGAVIYVGCSHQVGGRMVSHVANGKIFSTVSIVPSVFDRPIALEIERMLVRTLRPKLNVQHNPDQDGEPQPVVRVHLDQTENDAS